MIIHITPDNPLVLWMKTRPGRAITAAVFCVAFTLLMAFAVPVGVRQGRLAANAVPAGGEVLETKVFGGPETKTERNTAVRYRFNVDGVDYHYLGPTGGEWCDVSQTAMDDAARTGRIGVIYEAGRPWNNVPQSKQWQLWYWAVGLIALPVLLAAAMWIWVWRVARDEVGRFVGPAVTTP